VGHRPVYDLKSNQTSDEKFLNYEVNRVDQVMETSQWEKRILQLLGR